MIFRKNKNLRKISQKLYQIDFDKEGKPTKYEEVALWEELDEKTTYHQWIYKRKMIEGVSKSSIN